MTCLVPLGSYLCGLQIGLDLLAGLACSGKLLVTYCPCVDEMTRNPLISWPLGYSIYETHKYRASEMPKLPRRVDD
jgi:hypothetical protein